MKLHLGCGKLYLDGYINIDIDSPNADIKADIVNLDFINDKRIDEIYICHVLEHITRGKTINLFLEWNRLLKKEGVLRISVPNFQSIVDIYQKNKNMAELIGLINGGQTNKYDVHYICYDYKILKEILLATGFYDVQYYDCEEFLKNKDDYSKAYLPHMDKNGTLMSLNLICKKNEDKTKVTLELSKNLKQFFKLK